MENNQQEERLLSIKEAASLLSVNRATVAKWIREGKIIAVRVTGRTIRLRASDIQQIMSAKGKHCRLPDTIAYKKIVVAPENLQKILNDAGIQVSLTTLMQLFFEIDSLYQ